MLSCLVCLLVAAQSSAGELHPTPWWVDFLGQQSVLDDQPLPVGAVVQAYDPTGVLAGRAEVTVGGSYLMPVYGDDSTTESDEGAESQDFITFTVDDYPVVPTGPDSPVWPGPGSRAHVELRASSLAGDFDCDCQVTVADLMRQTERFGVSRGEAGYYPPFDRDGDDDIDVHDVQQVAGKWRTACQE